MPSSYISSNSFIVFCLLQTDGDKKRLKSIDADHTESGSNLHNDGHVHMKQERTANHNEHNKSGAELSSCQVLNKARTGITQPIDKVRSPPTGVHRNSLNIPGQCQYLPQGAPPYLGGSTSCMPGEQVYYPHHGSITANSGLLQPVSTSSALLQTPSFSSHQLQACQLTGQGNACALAPTSQSTGSHGYTGLTGSPTQAHGSSLTSLPSCTYMQSSQPYASHLTPNMSLMNIATTTHFSGPMAWCLDYRRWV